MKAICPVCGKAFTPPKKHHGGHPATYCSLRCRNRKNRLAYLEKLRAAGKARPSRAKVRAPRKCEFCGMVFTPKQENSKFCSKKCSSAEYFRRNREELREKERAYRATHPRPRPGRNVSASKARNAAPNLTFVQKRENPERESIARVEAYLSLPAAERWARRDTLTKKELTMAQAMWMRMKCVPAVYNYPRAVAR